MNIRLPILLVLFLLAGCGGDGGPQRMAVAVDIYSIKLEQVIEKIPAVGTVEAAESVEIKPEVSGVIDEINFQEGQFIKKDTVLIKLSSASEESQLKEAEANFELARGNYERAQKLAVQKTLSQQELDQSAAEYQAKQAVVALLRERLGKRILTAPFDGLIGARQVSVGQYIEAGSPITTLVASDEVKVSFAVPETMIGRFATGQKIELKVSGYEEENFEGKIFLINPSANEQTRTVGLKALVTNHDQKLKPGMFANVQTVVAERAQAITVPEEAVFVIGDAFSVYVADGDIARIRTVKLGIRLPGKVEVVEGLVDKEDVITTGLQKLADGSPIIRPDKKHSPSSTNQLEKVANAE